MGPGLGSAAGLGQPPPPPLTDSSEIPAASEQHAETQREYAGVLLRGYAFFMDYAVFILLGALCMALLEEFNILLSDDLGFLVGVAVIIFTLVWLYHAGLEASVMQGTLGKRLTGIKVINQSGMRCNLGQTSMRFITKLLSALLLGAGFIMIAFTKRKQGLHDIIAGSLVIKR